MDSKIKILLKFGHKVKELRKSKSLSQESLGYKSGLHRTYIGMIERGEKNITLINILKLSKALKINPSTLFDYELEK